jgi:predicted ThiF/HesA family dinucleotide-utilizing enzyme
MLIFKQISVSTLAPFLLVSCVGAGGQGGDTTIATPEVGSCNAARANGYLGRSVDEKIGADLMRLTGARLLRWAPPDTPMTMEYNADRLTVHYDRDLLITLLSCD